MDVGRNGIAWVLGDTRIVNPCHGQSMPRLIGVRMSLKGQGEGAGLSKVEQVFFR